jgi:hypothetical protein
VLLNEVCPIRPPKPSGQQTPEQAMNHTVNSFDYVCQLEGVGKPDLDAVRRALQS